MDMAINNIRANEPPPMSPYIRELEKELADMRALLSSAITRIKTLENRR